jgi:hypothetical protein
LHRIAKQDRKGVWRKYCVTTHRGYGGRGRSISAMMVHDPAGVTMIVVASIFA